MVVSGLICLTRVRIEGGMLYIIAIVLYMYPLFLNTMPCNKLYLQHVLSGLGSFVIRSPSLQVILILFTIHTFMDGLAEETIPFSAHWALELIHSIFIKTKSSTVCCFAVKAVRRGTFGFTKTPSMDRFKLFISKHL